MTYNYHAIENCNMCGSSADFHKRLGNRLNIHQGFWPKRKKGVSSTIYYCQKCGLVFSNPMPIPATLDDHYSINPKSYWKEEYFNVQEEYFQNEIAILDQLLTFEKGMSSLDIGAGIGKQMIALKNRGFDVYGFEPSRTFYEWAISKMNIPRACLKNSSIEEVEYELNSFDFVSFGAVLEHLPNPSGSISKALQWLKPGGIIHIEVPSSKWLISQTINLFYKLTHQDYVTNLSPMHEPYHLYEFDLRSFQNNSEINGYQIIHHNYFVCETFMPKLIDPIIRKYMKSRDKGMQLSIWLKKLHNEMG
jgi:2-polyprenyl-3-methyl-5-hydroxy-6-metoxy-1,4-benzoquinol methylase